jgi:hypothetical protein
VLELHVCNLHEKKTPCSSAATRVRWACVRACAMCHASHERSDAAPLTYGIAAPPFSSGISRSSFDFAAVCPLTKEPKPPHRAKLHKHWRRRPSIALFGTFFEFRPSTSPLRHRAQLRGASWRRAAVRPNARAEIGRPSEELPR